MCDNFYNPGKNSFTNTDDAILIRDYFQLTNSHASNSYYNATCRDTLCRGQRYSAGDMLTYISLSIAERPLVIRPNNNRIGIDQHHCYIILINTRAHSTIARRHY